MANLFRLQHRAPSLRTYEIPVEHGGGEAHHLGRVKRDIATGQAGVTVVKARLPTTITLCARGTEGDTSAPVDESVLRAPQIAAAVKAGLILPLLVPAAAPAPEVDQEAAPPRSEGHHLPPASKPTPPNALKKPAASLANPEEK